MISEEKYKEISKARFNVNQALVKKMTEKVIRKVGGSLGLFKKGKLDLEDDSSTDSLTDCAINDFKDENSKTIVQNVYEEGVFTKLLEKEYIEGLVNAKTSFFEIEDICEDKNIVILNDLLNRGRSIELTDVGFSHTAKTDYLTFLRPVSMCGGYITSGIILLYEKRTHDYILRQLQNRNNAKAVNDDLKKYSVFFKLGCRLPVEHK